MDRGRVMLIDVKPSELLEHFLADYKCLYPETDMNIARRYIKDGMRLATGTGSCPYFENLTSEWYRLLDSQGIEAAYQLYNDEYYFTDIWCCFVVYSRRYLRNIVKSSFPDGRSVADYVGNINSFVDLGCGVGYSTSALTEIFPSAKGYATNLKATKQWKLCEKRANEYNFTLLESVSEIRRNVDLVFASEYFEHIYDWHNHLSDVVNLLSPKYFLIANAFNTKALGHFPTYASESGETSIPEDKMTKTFNAAMKKLNYRQVKCKMWNNKPTLWERV